jgi:hypothetical protein
VRTGATGGAGRGEDAGGQVLDGEVALGADGDPRLLRVSE